MKAIIHAKIYDYINFIEDGFIIFDNEIREVGHMKDYKGHHEVFDAEGMLLLPGLVNGHTHIYSTLFRGAPLKASPENFLEILEQIWWKFDKALTIEMIKESTKVYAQASLLSGVTSLIDHHASGSIEGSLMTIHHELEKYSMKHILCFETSDRFDVHSCIEENTRYNFPSHFGLHASLSLSDETLKAVTQRLDKPIHIHVAEGEVDQLLCLANHQERVVKRLDAFDLLHQDSILAHCLYIDEDEAQIIKDRRCQIAINPSSNMNNAVGIYNNMLMQKYDIPILVGTDGLGPNIAKAYQNLYYVGNLSQMKPSQVSLDWIKLQLLNSYDYFNRMYGCKIGKIDIGYSSDFMLVDYHEFTPVHESNIFSHVLFGVFDLLKPYAVYVDGNMMIDKHCLIDPEQVKMEVVHELWRRL